MYKSTEFTKTSIHAAECNDLVDNLSAKCTHKSEKYQHIFNAGGATLVCMLGHALIKRVETASRTYRYDI